jgi:lipopolysaccharide export system permease protein
MEDILIEQLRTELQFTDPGHRFHITVAGVQHRTLQQPVIRYMRGQQVVTLKAESAEIQLDPEQQVAHVTLHNSYSETAGQRFVFNRDLHVPIRWAQRKNAPPPRNFPIEAIDEEIAGIDRTRSRAEERQILKVAMALSVADFRSAVDIQATGNSGLKRLLERKRKLRTEIHSRYALACSCLFFSLLGAPFSILFGKKQFLTSFLLCFLPIVGGYYPLMLGLMTQAKEGHIAPEWSMWVGNALLFIGSYFALRRVIRF